MDPTPIATPFLQEDTTLPVELPTELLVLPVAGTRLSSGTLADQLGPRPDALVFLRHFG